MNNPYTKIRRSLSLKLSISIVLLAIPIFVVALGVLFLQSRHIIRQEARERAESMLGATLQRVRCYLGTIETATNANAWLVMENLQPDSLLAYSARIVRMNVNVGGCSISTEPDFFPSMGRYFSAYSVRRGDSVSTVREAEYEYFDKVWYAAPRQLGRACWVDPFDDSSSEHLSAGEMIASYSYPLYTDEGRFVGVLSSDLRLQRLSEIINAEKPYPHSYYALLGEDGHYFVHPDTMLLVNHTIFGSEVKRQTTELIALGHEMTSGHSGVAEVELGGERSFVCYQPVPGTNWSLALVCAERDVLASYYHLTYILVPLIVVGLLLILVFSHSIVAHAIKPLRRLLDQSQQIASGRYDVRIRHTRRRDAVGRLQNSFALMQESLDHHVNDIRQMNAETEWRNRELANANKQAEEAGRQKTAFIQNMTHQIRTPLNIILGFAQVVRDGLGMMSAEDLGGVSAIMHHNALTLNRMLLMLYDSSVTGHAHELELLRPERLSCNALAHGAIGFVKEHFPGIEIAFDTTLDDSVTITTDSLFFQRSLREILYNSAKYSDGQHIALHLSADGPTARYVLDDTGPGISESYREMMYVPFTKVNDLSEGLGLGLPLTKRHVANLGGKMTYDASYREGCRFIIEMPLD